jgi:hypothetical protein
MRTAMAWKSGSVRPGATRVIKPGASTMAATTRTESASPKSVRITEATRQPPAWSPSAQYRAIMGMKVIERKPLASMWFSISGRTKATL